MDFNEYQEEAKRVAVYPKVLPDALKQSPTVLLYLTTCLSGEVGELAEKIKKLFRDKHGELTPEIKELLSLELGDILWYLSCFATELGIELNEVAKSNTEKVQKRVKDHTLHGDGDHR